MIRWHRQWDGTHVANPISPVKAAVVVARVMPVQYGEFKWAWSAETNTTWTRGMERTLKAAKAAAEAALA